MMCIASARQHSGLKGPPSRDRGGAEEECQRGKEEEEEEFILNHERAEPSPRPMYLGSAMRTPSGSASRLSPLGHI